MEHHSRIRTIKLIPMGNSKCIRIPKALIQKYNLHNSLLLEETDRGLLIRSSQNDKMSWEDTFQAMASEREDWSDFESATMDGLEDMDFEGEKI